MAYNIDKVKAIRAQGYRVVTNNATGTLYARHLNLGTVTYTDPTAEFGAWYEVSLRSGVATLGSISYNTTGQIIRREYAGTGWASFIHYSGFQTAAETPYTPSGSLISTNVQTAINELQGSKQPSGVELTALNSLTGTGMAIKSGVGVWAIRNFPVAAETLYTPSGTLVSTNVQTAINELQGSKQPTGIELTALNALTGTGFAVKSGVGNWAIRSFPIAVETPYTPFGNISGTNVQTAINELDTEKQGTGLNLNAISANTNSGFWVLSGNQSGYVRTLSGTQNQINVTNGNGISGNPVFSLNPILSGINSITPSGSTDFNISGGNGGGVFQIEQGANGSINIIPRGTGISTLSGTLATNIITSQNASNLRLQGNSGANILLGTGANASIVLTPSGTGVATISGNLASTAGRLVSTRIVTANATIFDSGYYYVIFNSTSGITGYLPVASTSSGRLYYLKNKATGIVTIDASGAGLIDGAQQTTLPQYSAITVVSDASTWNIF